MAVRRALICGATGIVGRAILEMLKTRPRWEAVGLSRDAARAAALGVPHVACDLADARACREAAAHLPAPTHLFFATWSHQRDEAENCAVNGAMLANAIEMATARGKLAHVALVTGLKHYLGLRPDGPPRALLDTPFREDQPRVGSENFYYVQEDILLAAAARHGFAWSVARPHTIIGYAPGNDMNLGTAIAVYATLARETGMPFRFPGSATMHDSLTDMSAADLIAEHLLWEVDEPRAANLAFNVVNGDIFRWRGMWGRIAEHFGVEVAPYPGRSTSLRESMRDAESDWARVVARHGLVAHRLAAIAPWWHVDADLGREQECVMDTSRSRGLGFTGYRQTWASFEGLFGRLRAEHILP
jgi:nucleoside-diphosphate-sugar epimerase